jgi:phosphate starvation-inducible protein PhoH
MVTRKRTSSTEEPQTGTVSKPNTNRLKLRLDDMITISPKTTKQKDFFDAYKRGDYFMCLHGVAGTGKTYIALYKALEEVMDRGNPFEQVVIIRSAVQSRDMGHLPGDANEKMDIYIQPYRQVTQDLFRRSDAWQRLYEQGHVDFMSTSFIRGTTFSSAILLVDEFQNMSFEELDTIITRVGHTSKIIFCGDIRQTDLKKSNDKTGLPKFLSIADRMKEFSRFEFTIDDIVRSSLVKNYIIAKTKFEDEQ